MGPGLSTIVAPGRAIGKGRRQVVGKVWSLDLVVLLVLALQHHPM